MPEALFDHKVVDKEQSPEAYFAEMEEVLIERHTADLSDLSPENQFYFLSPKAQHLEPARELRDRLVSGEKMTVKLGIDPTGSDLHLGHAMPMMMAGRMQRMGHDVVIVVGDYTAAIGDPTGRVNSRPVLTPEQIETNLAAYNTQLSRFLDLDRTRIVRNSEWLHPYALSRFLSLVRETNIRDLLQRKDFRERLAGAEGLTTAEVLYPILMGVDSVEIRRMSDRELVEIGGHDQYLNFHLAREIMRVNGQRPEGIITTPLLVGIDGAKDTEGRPLKMSKSMGNYISIEGEAPHTYGKLMSIPDHLIPVYLASVTEMYPDEVRAIQEAMTKQPQEPGYIHPMQAKKFLALVVTRMLSTKEDAHAAQQAFEATFQSKAVVGELALADVQASGDVIGLVKSILGLSTNSEARRLILGGSLKINGETVSDVRFILTNLTPGTEISVGGGKHRKRLVIS